MKIKLKCLDCGKVYEFLKCVPGIQRCPKCGSNNWIIDNTKYIEKRGGQFENNKKK